MKKKSIYVTSLLNLIFVIYALTFLIDSGLERLCIYISTFLWVIEGNYKEKFKQILNQKVILVYFGIIMMFLISLTFFSSSIEHGFWDAKYSNGYKYILSKNITYFLMAIYISTSLKKEYLKYLLFAFVLQTVYLAIYSYGIYFGFLKGNVDDPVHYMHHVFFSVALNLGFFSSLVFFLREQRLYAKILFFIFCTIMLIDLFIIGGRTGQLSFLTALISTLYYYIIVYKKRSYINIILPLFFIFTAFIAIFYISNNFQKRIEQSAKDIKVLFQKKDYDTSIGARIAFDVVNTNMLLSNPKNFIFGLGMGDSKKKLENYIKKTDINKLPILKYDHVHNQYFQIWIDGSIIALILYLVLFLYLLKLKLRLYDKILLVSFVATFLTISASDIIYHRGTILGLFALFIGYILALEKYQNQT